MSPDLAAPQRLRDGGLSRLLRKSFIALSIKILAAGLTFLMFATIAKALDARQFGQFAFAFSAASLLGLVACFGQGLLAVRFIPIYRSGNDALQLQRLLRFGYKIIFGTALILSLACVGVALAVPNYSHLSATGVLLLGMALAEYQAGVLRGMGSLMLAMLPRDVLWRSIVIAVVYSISSGALGSTRALDLSAGSVVAVVGTALIVMVALQFIVGIRSRLWAADGATQSAYDDQKREWLRVSIGLSLTSILKTGAENVCVIFVGLVLSPAASGGVFAALKVAMLMNFLLVAANLVVSPIIARAWHEGRLDYLRTVASRVTMISMGPTIAMFIAFSIAGPGILSWFGTEFRAFQGVLMVLALGQLVNIACGQTGVLLSMTGHERVQLRLIGTTSLPFLILILPAAHWFGAVGAASMIASSMAVWNIRAAYWTRKHLMIDTSVFGAITGYLSRTVV